ncbi:MAG: hypothetical protein K5765_03840 [Clostridia bacterium]|nr:hypothetical protein [Clostridia bacterium]
MFFQQFGLLFSNMQWYVAVLFVVGFIFLIAEVFTPGFGVFGILGLVFNVAAIVFRAVFHQQEDNVLLQVLAFLVFDILIIAFIILIVYILWKCNVLKKSPFFLKATAVDENRSDGTKDYSFLIGKEGKTFTLMRPSGKIIIDGKVYDAESNGVVIAKDVDIKVVSQTDSIIKIEEIDKKEE